MSTKKALTLSIVIPVYNEQHHIAACLDAITAQTVLPHEVLVVNNNCTDQTVKIAKTYPFVRVVNEKRQGRGWARTAGFNAANGAIIGRIDADSRLASNWVERVLAQFAEDDSLFGITGLGRTYSLPHVPWFKSTLQSLVYFWFVQGTFKTVTMWGANMAVRREAWRAVKNSVCEDDAKVHEDQDISLCMAARGLKIIKDNALLVEPMDSSYSYLPKFLHYWRLERCTYALHKETGTFKSKLLLRIPSWKASMGLALACFIYAPLFIMGVLWLPLDLLFMWLGKQKSWFG